MRIIFVRATNRAPQKVVEHIEHDVCEEVEHNVQAVQQTAGGGGDEGVCHHVQAGYQVSVDADDGQSLVWEHGAGLGFGGLWHKRLEYSNQSL